MARRFLVFFSNILVKILLFSDDEHLTILFNKLLSKSYSIRYKGYFKRYNLANSFRFNGKFIYFYGDGKIIIGENSYIGDYSTIQTSNNYKVAIGNNCSISHNVRIYTSSTVSDQDLDKVSEKKVSYGDVEIGNGVWIGANVFIKEGVKIGDNSVIGANSVVNKNVLPNTIFGGVPAKFIKNKTIIVQDAK